jgi:hypothetical protein
MKKNYQRLHLRAPYHENILFSDEGFVFKAQTLNISEGGILLDKLPHFPSREDVPMIISLPQFPYFKNFTLERLKLFTPNFFEAKVLRVKCQMVRRINTTTDINQVFISRIGIKFTEIGRVEQKIIADYVETFSSNLIYLQILLDSIQADKKNLEKVQILSKILGYELDLKIALLRKQVTDDYRSLQWL